MQILFQTLVVDYFKKIFSSKEKDMNNPLYTISTIIFALINLAIFEVLLSSSISKLLIVEYSFSEVKAVFITSIVFLAQALLVFMGMFYCKKEPRTLNRDNHSVKRIISSFFEGFQHR